MENILTKTDEIITLIECLGLEDKISVLNEIKKKLHSVSPFKEEPVDCVLWVNGREVEANDYNPNSVAPKEMELLATSIRSDGYTQPIVTFDDGKKIVVDGFHRHKVGKEVSDIRSRVHGFLPVVMINEDRQKKSDRMASTIRHNRARGKHAVESMSDIVLELSKRNWSDAKIAKELGMDADEVLRLKQITGLAELFSDREFSEAWEVIEHTPSK